MGFVGFFAYPRDYCDRVKKCFDKGYEEVMKNMEDPRTLDLAYDQLPMDALTWLHLRILAPVSDQDRAANGGCEYKCALCNKWTESPFRWRVPGQTTLPLGDDNSSSPVGASLLLSPNAARLTYKGWDWWGIPGSVGGGNLLQHGKATLFQDSRRQPGRLLWAKEAHFVGQVLTAYVCSSLTPVSARPTPLQFGT